jgi:hypothetical protein
MSWICRDLYLHALWMPWWRGAPIGFIQVNWYSVDSLDSDLGNSQFISGSNCRLFQQKLFTLFTSEYRENIRKQETAASFKILTCSFFVITYRSHSTLYNICSRNSVTVAVCMLQSKSSLRESCHSAYCKTYSPVTSPTLDAALQVDYPGDLYIYYRQ